MYVCLHYPYNYLASQTSHCCPELFVCMYVYIHMYMHADTDVCRYVCMYCMQRMYAHTRMWLQVCMYHDTSLHVCNMMVHIHNIYIYIYMHTYAWICPHMLFRRTHLCQSVRQAGRHSWPQYTLEQECAIPDDVKITYLW